MSDNKVIMNLDVVKAMTKKGFVLAIIGFIVGLLILVPSFIFITKIKLMYFIVLLTCGFFASSLSLMIVLTYAKLYKNAKSTTNSAVSNFLDDGIDFSFYVGERVSQSAILKYAHIKKVNIVKNYLIVVSKMVTLPLNYDEEVINFLKAKQIKVK